MYRKIPILIIGTILGLLMLRAFVLPIKNLVPATSNALDKKSVILDAGHGIPDKGASSEAGHSESEINLKIASKTKKLLEKSKIKVILTRTNKFSLSDSATNNKRDDLNERVKIRDNSDADLFVSIHMNYFPQTKYSGAQVFYNDSLDESKTAARFVQKSLRDLIDPGNNREIKSDNDIFVLKNAKIPSILVECGFLSNPEEAELLNTDEYQNKVSWAIYCGICNYLNES